MHREQNASSRNRTWQKTSNGNPLGWTTNKIKHGTAVITMKVLGTIRASYSANKQTRVTANRLRPCHSTEDAASKRHHKVDTPFPVTKSSQREQT